MGRAIQDLSFKFAINIVKNCNSISKSNGLNNSLITQLLKCGSSIGANVQEAEAAQSKRKFLAKMYIAFKETRETIYWLKLFRELNISDIKTVNTLIYDSIDLLRLLSSITKTRRAKIETRK
jgi:four helix bundle protein